MGKKKSGRATGDTAATAFVLKVPMHCRCDGCADKIRAAVKDLALRCEGILSLDQSALATKGELAVVATADPERLQRRLRKATGKSVGLVFPEPPAAKPAAAQAKDNAATVQALLAGLQRQPGHGHHLVPAAAGTWNALQQGGYGPAYAYPWVLQQAPPEPYFASYPATAYPTTAASWGAYPHDGLGGGWPGF